jgi:Uma2 family endonuclease
MSNTTDHVTTAEQLAAMPDDGKRYELVEGVLQMMSPTGGQHASITAKLSRRIGVFVEDHDLGDTLTGEPGFVIGRNPDTVRAPDVAFLSKDRLSDLSQHTGYLPVAPDLAAEVVSPHDRAAEVDAKADVWLKAGVRVVLVVDPRTEEVRVHRPGRDVERHRGGFVDLNDVLPGFQLDIAELFA